MSNLGPVTRSLLTIRDAKLRRCWWCGAFAYDKQDCGECESPAVRPIDIQETA